MAADKSYQKPPPGLPKDSRENPPDDNYTLEPLRTDGPDALATDGTDDIVTVKLCRIDLGSPNAFHEVTTKTADDLFRSAAAAGKHRSPFPLGAELLRATFAFLFKDSPIPHSVDLAPPAALTLQFPADAPELRPSSPGIASPSRAEPPKQQPPSSWPSSSHSPHCQTTSIPTTATTMATQTA